MAKAGKHPRSNKPAAGEKPITEAATPWDEDEVVSKTAVKKAMHELQVLGEQLMALSEKAFAQIPLGDATLDAMEQAKKMKPGNGRRRQVQFIGKLMRGEDEEAIRTALAKLQQQDRGQQRQLQEVHQWYERLLSDDNNGLTAFFKEFPHSDHQQMNQLIRLAKKERQQQGQGNEQKLKKQGERLFKAIQALVRH